MQTKRITFIGGGNMAGALLARLAEQKGYDLRVSDPGDAQREKLGKLTGVDTYVDNEKAVDGADCVIFAVKPQIMRGVCTGLAKAVAKHQPLLVSIAAGIGCDPMSRWFDGYRRIVRVMPNTPALVGAGATGLFGDSAVTEDDTELVTAVFDAVGQTAWVDSEDLIDVVTAVSGSGPAYFFYIIEAMEDAAVAQGMPRALAQQLARQTALGAARMALGEDGSLDNMRQCVTSPGGTTAAAIDTLAEHKLPSIMAAAMNAARARAHTLADEFGTD